MKADDPNDDPKVNLVVNKVLRFLVNLFFWLLSFFTQTPILAKCGILVNNLLMLCQSDNPSYNVSSSPQYKREMERLLSKYADLDSYVRKLKLIKKLHHSLGLKNYPDNTPESDDIVMAMNCAREAKNNLIKDIEILAKRDTKARN